MSSRDREGGVWITSCAGIQRVELAMTQFGRSEGLNGSVYCIARYRGTALCRHRSRAVRAPDGGRHPPRFEAVPDIKSQVYELTPTAQGLLVATQGGVYTLAGGEPRDVVRKGTVWDIGVSVPRSRDRLRRGTVLVIQKLRWDGSAWTSIGKLPAVVSRSGRWRKMPTAAHGSQRKTRFSASTGQSRSPSAERFGTAQGVPVGFKNVYRLRGDIVFSSDKGLLQFDAAKSAFVPWTGFGAEFADGSRPVSIVAETARGLGLDQRQGLSRKARHESAGVASDAAAAVGPDRTIRGAIRSPMASCGPQARTAS